nr:transaldolase family protein [Nostoc sp. WHI]
MTTNHLQEINQCGQSIWMDNLSRGIMKSGEFKDLQRISGINSNSAIFEKAIASDKTQGINAGNIIYNANIEAGVSAGLPTSEIYESLVFADIRNACNILCPRPHL